MSQDSHVSASFSAPVRSRVLLPSQVIEIRNCLQMLLGLEYTLEQSRVVVDNVRKIDKLLSDETPLLEALRCANSATADLR